MKNLRGKRALITGAGSGIGRAIALELARQGTHIWLLEINELTLESVGGEARSCGVDVVARRCDLSRADEIRSAFDEVLKTWGGIDILVNNAGIIYYGATENISDQQWAEVLAINLTAPIMLTRLFLPSLLERHDAHILNVCSIYGLVPKRRLAAYQTAKFALVGFSQSLRLEYGPRGLGITALCPGLVRTDLIGAAEKSGRLKNRLTLASHLAVAPEIVALRAVQAIQKDQGLIVVTLHARALWLVHRCFPRLLDRWQYRKRRPRR
jgi:NAD(P)-dependent dehydrogenase (short-subunit alcohol dehydrogenase family)